MNEEVIIAKRPSYWWVPLLFGVAFILIGFWILRSPEDSIKNITRLIGVIILVSGIIQLIFTIKDLRGMPGWGFLLSGDVFDIAIGLALLINPSLLLKLITLFVGVWLIVNSISIFVKAADAKKTGKNIWTWEFGLAVFLMILAVIILWHPMLLGISIAVWTGLAFIIMGIFRIMLTFRLRKLG